MVRGPSRPRSRRRASRSLAEEPAPWQVSALWNRPAALALAIFLIHLALAFAAASPVVHNGGDNAAYLALANALVETGSYAETWHPESPPHAKYPPLYPGALALVMLMGAKTWGVFKAASAVFTGLAAAFCFLWVERLRGPRVGAAVALLFAISPALLQASQWILSEPLFLACTFGALWLLAPRAGPAGAAHGQGMAGARGPARADHAADSASPLSHRDLAVGLTLAAAAYLTRSAGLPLVVAAGAWLALTRRRRSLAAFGAAFAAVALPWQLRSGGDYVSEFRLVNPYAPDLGQAGLADMVQRVTANAADYGLDYIPAGMTGLSGAPAVLAGALLAVAAAAGWALRVRRGPGAPEIFCLLYAGLILVWPVQWSGDRFALPLLPPALLYAGEAAAAAFAGRLSRPALAAVAAGAVMLVAVPAGRTWLERVGSSARCAALVDSLGPLGCYGANVRQFQAMALWSRDGLPPGSVVFSRKPRLFHAFSGHPSVTYPFSEDPGRLLAEADSLGVGHVVLGNWDFSGRAYLTPAIAAQPERFCVAAQLEAPGGPPIVMLAIRPAGPDDADGNSATERGVTACLVDSPAPPAAAMASMIVPILERP